MDGCQEILDSLTESLENNDTEEESDGELSCRRAKVARICPKVKCGLYAPEKSLKNINIANNLGMKLANKLLSYGARKLLDEAKAANITPPNVPPPLSHKQKIAENESLKITGNELEKKSVT